MAVSHTNSKMEFWVDHNDMFHTDSPMEEFFFFFGVCVYFGVLINTKTSYASALINEIVSKSNHSYSNKNVV